MPFMRYRIRTLLILLAIGATLVAFMLAWSWAWSEYKSFIMRQRLTPIPVPSPP